jgi:hypothetical protein
LVVVLAFLSASFIAQNSDLWSHLAAGRLLAQGEYTFGTDPFAYTTEQVYWANHAWLYDLGLYGLFLLAGGTGLVIAKAMLIAVLAWLLIGVRRRDPVRAVSWVPAFFTTLAVLAMGPRLLLRPTGLSYFLLGLTFWLLWRPQSAKDQGGRMKDEPNRSSFILRPSSFFLLFVFVLWGNVDQWFWLGPLLAALFWLGERIQGVRRTPGWLIPAGLAVCLLNPHTVYAFTLPDELAPVTWTSGLRQDVRFELLFGSPWRAASLQSALRLNAAALAYFALTGLGLVSFALYPPALRGWRLLVWLPFAFLAAWQTWAVPFFAVVAAPVTALNWQDFFIAQVERRARSAERGAQNPWLFALRALRSAFSLSLLALIFLTWGGWLAGRGAQRRHVAWGIRAEPSLRRAAEALGDWRQRGLLREGERVLALAPEVADYSAWFCPGERHFFDHRFGLYSTAAGDYETVCRALLPGLVRDESEAAETNGTQAADWRRVLHGYGVGVVVFYDRDPRRLFAVLGRLAGDRKHWTLLDVAGQVLTAGWNAARPPGGFAALAFDADRLAFGPQDAAARLRLPAAPAQGPAHLPGPPGSWDRWAEGPAPSSWESTAATMYLHYFDDTAAGQARERLHRSLSQLAASLVGTSQGPVAGPQAALPLCLSRNVLGRARTASIFLVRGQLGPYFSQIMDRSPALPLLAVRAARRAVADNPHDANAWLRLGQAYLGLSNDTHERFAEDQLPPLAELRHVQVVTTLEQAVRLDPNLQAAHHELSHLYGRRRFFDQALEHQRQDVRLLRLAGPRPDETDVEWVDRLELLDKDLAKLEELVEERRGRYAAAAPKFRGNRGAQAGVALRLGLARLAVDDVLLPTPAEVLGAPGMRLELQLLLELGRVEEVRALFADEALAAHKEGLLFHDLPAPKSASGQPLYQLPYHWPTYDWLHAVQAAAVGDYAQAQAALHAIGSRLRMGQVLVERQLPGFEPRIRSVLSGLLSGPPAFLPAFSARAMVRLLQQRAFARAGGRVLRAQQADLDVLEGLLGLERGATQAARLAFTRALKRCALPSGAAVPFAGEPLASSYLRKLKEPFAK